MPDKSPQAIDKQRFFSLLQRHQIAVSADQLEALEIYAQNLEKWQKSVNLVGPDTIDELWTRHILDSLQLLPHVSRGTILDFGSGGGLPAVPLAIMNQKVFACERISKKTTFLKHVSRETNTQQNLTVLTDDVRNVNVDVDVITARAVADINLLLTLTEHYHHKDILYVLPKGQNYENEILKAKKQWQFNIKVIKSIISSDSVIILLTNVTPKS